MRRLAERYYQYDQQFISLTLDYETINKHSEVLIYGESKYGYQRQVSDPHLNRMVSTLRRTDEILSPTSILLGVSPESIEKCLEPIEIQLDKINKDEKVFIFDTSKIVDFKFRIIDGQHRIKAFEKFFLEPGIDSARKEKLSEYSFNVIIAIIPETNRIQEVELFRTINSKAKPLKTDLAMLAKYNYEVMYKKTDIDIKDHIKTRIIFYLNDTKLKGENSCWSNGIKVDINNNRAFGAIGFKAFGDSIDKIVDHFTKNDDRFSQLNSLVKDLEDEKVYLKIESVIEESSQQILKQLIIPAWAIIAHKWAKAFVKEEIYIGDEISEKYYNLDYYIQQTMGVKALHGILTDIYCENTKLDVTVDKFNDLIIHSNLKEGDWLKGGRMKGLSSEAGFRIIREMIIPPNDRGY